VTDRDPVIDEPRGAGGAFSSDFTSTARSGRSRGMRRMAWAFLVLVLAVVFAAGFFAAVAIGPTLVAWFGGEAKPAAESTASAGGSALKKLAITPPAEPAPVAAPEPATAPPPPDVAARAAVTARIDALAGELAALGAVAERVAVLERAVAEGRATAAADLARALERVNALEARIRDLAREPGSGEPGRVAILLAAGDLRAAVRGGAYRVELDAVNQLIASSPWREDAAVRAALATLGRYQDAGLPTLAQLRARLAAAAGAIAGARLAPGTWVDRLLDRAAQVVTIRKVGEIEGASAEARVARAERRLETGDVAAAVAELGGLSGGPAQAAAPWLADAAAALAGDRAAAALYARIARLLTDQS
jgi:uroporphyrinogen-III synthase